jgi:hypothetical protein
VVLATVAVPKSNGPTGDNNPQIQISYVDRRVLLATQRLQTALMCLP